MDMAAREDAIMPAREGDDPGRRQPRHATVLLVGRLRRADEVSACLVQDISCGGMRLRFGVVPQIGERLSIAVRGLADTMATVCWIDGVRGGVAFEREQDITGVFRSHDDAGRIARSPRFAVQGATTLRVGERRLAVDLIDVSPGGAKIDTTARLRRGDAASMVLPGSPGAVFGTICWTSDTRAGLRFTRPLTLATLSQVLAGA